MFTKRYEEMEKILPVRFSKSGKITYISYEKLFFADSYNYTLSQKISHMHTILRFKYNIEKDIVKLVWENYA